MASLIETLIYLLAIMGIIFTSITFIEIFNYSNYSSYNLFCKKTKDDEKRVEILVNMKNLTEEEEDELLDILLTGDYTDLEKLVDTVRVDKQ